VKNFKAHERKALSFPLGRSEVKKRAYRGRQVRNKWPGEKGIRERTRELNDIYTEDYSDLPRSWHLPLHGLGWKSTVAPLGRHNFGKCSWDWLLPWKKHTFFRAKRVGDHSDESIPFFFIAILHLVTEVLNWNEKLDRKAVSMNLQYAFPFRNKRKLGNKISYIQ